MKRQQALLALTVALAAVALWFSRSSPPDTSPTPAPEASQVQVSEAPHGPIDTAHPTNPSAPARVHRPPNPSQRFIDFTPEKRVEFARRGSGPGG